MTNPLDSLTDAALRWAAASREYRNGDPLNEEDRLNELLEAAGNYADSLTTTR